MYRGTPRFSDSGVKSTTTSSGTIKIRESVSALGRFTQELRRPILVEMKNNPAAIALLDDDGWLSRLRRHGVFRAPGADVSDVLASRVYGSLFFVSRQRFV